MLSIYPDTEGEVVLAFVVGRAGKVVASDILVNTTGVFELACCIENRLSTWQFPASDCTTHLVSIPFSLR